MSRNLVLTDEQSRLNARLEAHMVYICPECGKAFRTQVEWRQHLNTKHEYLKKTYVDFNFTQIDDRFHECQTCFKWVENAHKTIAMLQYHYFMHLVHSKTYRCVHCRMAYTRRRALNAHLLDTHMREIEKYEAKLRQMRRNEEQKALQAAAAAAATGATKPPTKMRGRPKKPATARKRKDLLAKALMDIDLQTEDDKGANPITNNSALSPNTKPLNPSEQNLDRCLNAYEDILRKEQADLDALCEEFFVEKVAENEEEELLQKSPEPKANGSQEVVIIEIDALGREEVDQLQKEHKPSGRPSPPSKRRRMSDIEEPPNTQELTKLISYLCPKCGKEISSMDTWRAHVFEKHDFEHFIENSFKIIEPGRKSMCLQCREIQTTTKRSELQKHCFKHLPYRSYLKCSLCDRTKTSMSKMYNHIRYNHQDELQRKNKTQLIVKPEPRWNISPKHRPSQLSAAVGNGKPESPQNDEDDDDGHLVCEYCNKVFRSYWRHKRHVATCTRAGTFRPQSAFDAEADVIMQHLREGCLRMSTIWRNIQES